MYAACFILAMLPPALMLCVGIMWKVSPPKMNGKALAYRTALSTRSEETWNFAHRHCSKLWIRLGIVLGLVSALLMWFLREQYLNFILWLLAGQMVFFCLSAFLVDLLLKNGFDDHGNKLM